jgi:hypothetical protein
MAPSRNTSSGRTSTCNGTGQSPKSSAVTGSAVTASAVTGSAGGAAGPLLAHLARTAFVSGMDLGLFTAALVALAGAATVLAWLPARSSQGQI